MANELEGKIKINDSKLAFKMMENIGNFKEYCNIIGVDRIQLFETVSLYEATNLPRVIRGIHAFAIKVSNVYV